MPWKLVYFDEVFTDIKETKEWYFKQQKGLEKRFAKDVKNCLSRLQKNPFHYELRYRNVRLAHCSVFPYSIHFLIDEPKNQLVIIAIVHQNRDPNLAQSR